MAAEVRFVLVCCAVWRVWRHTPPHNYLWRGLGSGGGWEELAAGMGTGAGQERRTEVPVGGWRGVPGQAVAVGRAGMMGVAGAVTGAGEEGVHRERAVWIGRLR